MRILVLHQVPFRKIGYDALLDHDAHEVTYLGTEASLAQVPADLRHTALAVADPAAAADEWAFAEEVATVLPAQGPAAVDAVVSLSEFGHYAGAVARRHYGLPAHTDQQIARVRDKVEMKRAVQAAGLAIPRFSDGAALHPPAWTGPTIVKPRDGAGSTGVRSFATVAEALAARGAEDELEEYVDAPVLHVDGFVEDGRLRAATVAECLGSPLEYAQGRVIASVQARRAGGRRVHRGLARRAGGHPGRGARRGLPAWARRLRLPGGGTAGRRRRRADRPPSPHRGGPRRARACAPRPACPTTARGPRADGTTASCSVPPRSPARPGATSPRCSPPTPMPCSPTTPTACARRPTRSGRCRSSPSSAPTAPPTCGPWPGGTSRRSTGSSTRACPRRPDP
ncbi:hypothetical protein G5V59_17115 [Nocardioides sp. W3-2-3]|uniref:hypothetical protein n=1 Tax=Nocardioides convexus TaxID=2712224 RepID=UPI00241836F0|nr:hypothetical protein [Nocardioides convexus]NHA01017.1 hypothetical protein [Nocardioides convexus]